MAALPAALRSRPWARAAAVAGLVLLALVLLVAFFPWDTLRGPVGRFVSAKTGRHFEITRHLDVKVGRTTRVLMEGITFANPDWAQDRELVRADAAEIQVRLLPLLLHRRIELPLVRLTRPQLGLQQEPDGRKTWALGGNTQDRRNVPDIGAFVVDQGTVHYVARHQGADVRVEFAMDREPRAAPQALPLRFKAQGRWQQQPFTAEGRTGDVLYLSAPLQQPFPAEIVATAGRTRLQAHGSVASLATLDGADVQFRLEGQNLAELYRLVGVVLPDTPHYALAGRLSKRGETWRMQQIDGRLGRSDIAGELAFEKTGQRPHLAGRLKSGMLDFEDLAPLIGMDDKPVAAHAPNKKGGDKAARDPSRKVLPDAPIDVSRLNAMNADVRIDAARVVNAKGLPLDRMGVQVHLDNGVLVLDPLDLGVAGGQLAGRLRIDANAKPVATQARLDARALELGKLVPRSQSLRNSFGKLQAQVDLTSRGGSVAQMLAHANGNVAMLMGRGQISNILLEFAGLDAGEIIKFFVEGDQRVPVRCAALAFGVEQGVMTSRAFLLDTTDTVFYGNARVDFARETLDITVQPQPKDRSILSLRSPLHVGGTFGAPQVGVDKGALAGRAAAAVALAAINPLLGLAATVETGPGHDADCVGTLRRAGAGRAEARVQQTAPPAAGAGGKGNEEARRMGAAPGPRGEAAPPNGQKQPAAPQLPAGGTPGKPIAP